MKKSIVLLAISMVLTSLGSCKKAINTSENQVKVIVDKKWKMAVYTEDGVDKLHEQYGDCDLDDITIYRANRTVENDQGVIKCDDDEPQITTGKWQLINNQLYVGQDGVGLQLVFNVVEISATTLRLTMKNPFGTEILAYTFKAQ